MQNLFALGNRAGIVVLTILFVISAISDGTSESHPDIDKLGFTAQRHQKRILLEKEIQAKVTLIGERNGTKLFHIHAKGKASFGFENAPKSIHGLQQSPRQLENNLKKGNWIVLVANGHSIPDLICVLDLTDVVKANESNIQFGVRPFLKESENSHWCPECLKDGDVTTPIWVKLKDGKVKEIVRGVQKRKEIETWIKKK